MKSIFLRLKLGLVGILLCFSLIVSAQSSQANSEVVWLTDIKQAAEVSNASGKPIFAFFAGCDWCGWCHKLQREVFSKPEFANWAEQNVVLVELDFPRSKRLPEAIARQNAELQQVFKVSGFPTVWLFTLSEDKSNKKFTIKAFGSLGYPANATIGHEQIKFIDTANELLKYTK